MAQFDVFRLFGGQLVVEMQTGLIGIAASRVAAPLREAWSYTAFPGLTPTVEIAGQTWIVRRQDLAAIPGSKLTDHVGSLDTHCEFPKRAFDILIDGI